MKYKLQNLSSSVISKIIYVIHGLIAVCAVSILATDGVRASCIIAALMLVVAAMSLTLFQLSIKPKLVQHDLAVNTLLTISPNSDGNLMDGQIPPLSLLTDEVLQYVRDNYQAMLSYNQNSMLVLQSQINPHFLYNTLDCIRGEALEAGMDNIASMVESLSSFFRYSISSGDILVQLRDELHNIQIYYSIQKYRFNDRFSLEVEVEDDRALDCYLPKLTLQPIVENCILHGLEFKFSGGFIQIHICLTDQRVIITISDNGEGMSPNELEQMIKKINSDIQPSSEHGIARHGIALQNINKQLKLLFGAQYGISVSSRLNVGTEVEIQIPAVFARRNLQ